MDKKAKNWPADCVWPEPVSDTLFGPEWDPEDLWDIAVDEEGEELLEIKEYFDSLVMEGRLDEDYRLNDSIPDSDEWEPEKGEDYWDPETGFDIENELYVVYVRYNCFGIKNAGGT